MGNLVSKFDEWRDISDRKKDNPNERWEKIFRYGGGALGVGSALGAYILLLKYINNPKIGGLKLERPNMYTKSYFNWHILSMGTSFLLLMAPSVITFEVLPLERHSNKDLHNILNTLSLGAGILGMLIIIDSHQRLTKGGSFRSVHGITGYLTMSLLLSNWLGGFIMYVMGKGGPLRGSLKPLHKRLGMLTVLLGLSNVCLGLMEKQTSGRFNKGDLQKLTHRIAFLTLLSFMGIYSAVNKFEDKSDPKN